MPINRLLREGKIKPGEVERLNRAFTYALNRLHLVDRNDPVCDNVARKVIEIDRAGIHDPVAISRSQPSSLEWRKAASTVAVASCPPRRRTLRPSPTEALP